MTAMWATWQARVALAAVTAALCIGGVFAWRQRLIAQGDAQGAGRVQQAWDAETYQRNLATGQANAVRQRAAEKVADEHAQRQAQTAVAIAAARTTERSLRAEIQRLNRRPQPYAADESGLAACTREATTARQLLGACSQRYTVLAADADGLRIQLLGLHQWVARVCPVPATGGGQ